MKSTIGIELVTTMLEDEAPRNPFNIWDGHLPLHTMLDLCNICSSKGMFNNSIGNEGVGVNKPSLETSLEEQTLTLEGLKKKSIFEIRWGL